MKEGTQGGKEHEEGGSARRELRAGRDVPADVRPWPGESLAWRDVGRASVGKGTSSSTGLVGTDSGTL